MPVVYSTAYYSLVVRGRLRPGESVLIHSGSGGVGQAAIAIALSQHCRVFTTVGEYRRPHTLQPVSVRIVSAFSHRCVSVTCVCVLSQVQQRSVPTYRSVSPSSPLSPSPTLETPPSNSTSCYTHMEKVRHTLDISSFPNLPHTKHFNDTHPTCH